MVMLLDLHIHTNRYSRCSLLKPHDMIQRAKEICLDGLAITEHDRLWSPQEIAKLREETEAESLVLLRGKEIERELRHLLIFNYPHKIRRQLPLREVIDEVHREEGIVVLAHPFRYGRFLDLPLADLKDMLSPFDAVEILTTQHSERDNQKALLIQESLNLVGIGCSDSHDRDQIGRCVTYFPTLIKDEGELARAIMEGACKPLWAPSLKSP